MTEDGTVDGHGRTDALRLVLGSLVAASRGIGRRTVPPGAAAADDDTAAAGAGADERPALDLRYLALGAFCAAEDGVMAVARAGVGAARTLGRPVAAVAQPLVPGALRRELAARLEQLDRYGRAVAAAGSEEAVEVVEGIADDVVSDPFVMRLIEQIVDELQWRVVDAVLPVVLERLTAEPEQVRALVQQQSLGMAEELVQEVQARAAGGDEAVDRLIGRLLHRRPKTDPHAEREPRQAQTALPSGP